MPYPPGMSGYLTDRGTLFYNGRTPEQSFLSRFPFKGGAVLEADWNGKVLWEIRYPDHHHHGILLRNGNVLLHCLGQVPGDIARRVSGGMVERSMQSGAYAPRPDSEADKMYSDYLAEVTRAGQTAISSPAIDQRPPSSASLGRPGKSFGSLVRRRSPVSMRQPCWRMATSSYSTTEFIVSMTRCHTRG